MGEAKRRGTFEERRDRAEKRRDHEQENADAAWDKHHTAQTGLTNLTLGGRQTGIGHARTYMRTQRSLLLTAALVAGALGTERGTSKNRRST